MIGNKPLLAAAFLIMSSITMMAESKDKSMTLSYNDVNTGRNIGLTYNQSFNAENTWIWYAGMTYHINNR